MRVAVTATSCTLVELKAPVNTLMLAELGERGRALDIATKEMFVPILFSGVCLPQRR